MKRFKKTKRILGFTLVELLVVILVTSIFLMAVLGVFLMGNKYLKESKPVSDVIEEARSGLATLEFLFSRRGVGVPPKGDNFTGIPPANNTCPLKNKNSTLTCYNGDLCSSSGCKDLEFYANIKGFGFVVNATNNTASLVSCRLSSEADENYYYVFKEYKLVNATQNGTTKTIFRFCENFGNGPHCVNNLAGNLTLNNPKMYLNGTNCTDANNTITLQPGDIIMRVPYKVRLKVDWSSDYKSWWLMINATDLATGKSSATWIARVKDENSFNATCLDANCTALKVRITFQSQSKPEQTFTVERIFSREVR